MGMFDEIAFEYPTPDPEVQGVIFQTKSFSDLMNRYVLANDGILYHDEWRLDEDGNSEYGNFANSRVATQFTGSVYCYTSFKLSHKHRHTHYKYHFELENGKLVSAIDREDNLE